LLIVPLRIQRPEHLKKRDAAQRGQLMGFLCVEGHVRTYAPIMATARFPGRSWHAAIQPCLHHRLLRQRSLRRSSTLAKSSRCSCAQGPVAHRTRHHRSLPPVALGIQGAEACVLQSRAAEDQCGEDPEEGAERGATRRLTLTQNLNGRRGRSSAPLSTDLHLDITASWEPCGCVSVYQSSARAARCSCYRV